MLTNQDLILDQLHPTLRIGGIQRIYRFASGYGLSLVNSPMLHAYPFAWEAAVLKDISEDGKSFKLTYDTELSSDIEVFSTDEEANSFIERAASILGAL